jgi:hypothetical protein
VVKVKPQKSIRLPSVDDMMKYLHSQRALNVLEMWYGHLDGIFYHIVEMTLVDSGFRFINVKMAEL